MVCEECTKGGGEGPNVWLDPRQTIAHSGPDIDFQIVMNTYYVAHCWNVPCVCMYVYFHLYSVSVSSFFTFPYLEVIFRNAANNRYHLSHCKTTFMSPCPQKFLFRVACACMYLRRQNCVTDFVQICFLIVNSCCAKSLGATLWSTLLDGRGSPNFFFYLKISINDLLKIFWEIVCPFVEYRYPVFQ